MLIAGEAGIGKTALVRAFCARDSGRRRVLWGACDAALHAASARPVRATSPTEAGGELGAASWRDGAAAGRAARRCWRELRARPPDVVVLEDLHWADEATLDVAAPARPPHRRRCRRSCSAPTATTSSTARHPLRIVLGELPAAAGGAGWRCAPLSRAARSPSWPARRGVDAAELHRAHRRQPVLRHRGARGRRRRACPTTVRDAVLARAARLDDRRARAARRRGDRRRRAPSCGCSRRWRDGELERARRVPGARACCAPSGDAVALPPRDRARGRRGGAAAAPARSRCTGGRCAALAERRAGRIPPASPTTPRRPATPTRCCATPRRPASGRRRSAPTARRPRSSPARCAYGDRPAAAAARRAARAPLVRVLPDRHDVAEAIDARRRALDEPPRDAATACREGDAHRWLSRLPVVRGRQRDGRARRRDGRSTLLEPLAARARARDGLQQHGAAADAGQRPAAARPHWGERAIELAERLGETEIARPRAQQRRARPSWQRGDAGRASPSSSAASRWRCEDGPRGARRPARTPTSATRSVALRDYAVAAIADLDAGHRVLRASMTSTRGSLYMLGWRGALRARAGALGRRRRHGDAACWRRPTRPVPTPDHRRSRCSAACARAGAIPTHGRRSTRRCELARGTGEAAAPRAGGRRPRGGAVGWRARARLIAAETERRDSRSSGPRSLGRRASSTVLARGAPGSRDALERDAVAEPYRLELAGDHEAAAERVGRDRLPVRGGASPRPSPTTRPRSGEAFDRAASASAPIRRPRRVARTPARARSARRPPRARGPRRATTPPG